MWPALASFLPNLPSDPGEPQKLPESRRVVVINPAGSILSEHEFDLRRGHLAMAQSGLWQEYIRDWSIPTITDPIGRLMEMRTYGWSAAWKAENPNNMPTGTPVEPEDGLVYVYDYDTTDETSMEIGAQGVRSGTPDDDVIWQRQFIRHPDRRDLVRFTIEFTNVSAVLYPYSRDFTGTEIASMAAAGGFVTYGGFELVSTGT